MEPRSRRIGGNATLRGRLSVAISLGALLALSLNHPVMASTAALDQSETVTTGSYQSLSKMAQAFTPGVTGMLDQVSLYAGTAGSAAITFQVEIWNVTGGNPVAVYQFDSTHTASTTVTAAFGVTLRWRDLPLSRPVSLLAGNQYAIVVRSINTTFHWGFESFDTYPGGKLLLCCSTTGTWMSGFQFGRSFDFKTWMSTGTNQAPNVASDNATVAVNEGLAPTNTGTYSDPDGDTVTLSASSGTVTASGGASSGTWSWTQPAADESSSQNVTITADDGNALNSAATFAVSVAGTAPAAHLSSSPASSPEGTPVSLSASATSPAAADNSVGFTYSWSVTKNGNPFTGGSGASIKFTPDDEGAFMVTLRATDDGGMTGTTTATVTGANVAPTAVIAGVTPSAPLVLTAQESVSFAGSFSDPGALDSHTVTWSFGDGATSTAKYGPGGSAALSTTHTYSSAGSPTVTLTVTDDDGGVGQATAKVVVETPQQALSAIVAYVQGLPGLNGGQKNSLIAKLNAASASVGRGDTTAAGNQLGAFLNELQADVNTGNVSAASAATLRAAVHAVQASLGTYNRFLEWWPLEA